MALRGQSLRIMVIDGGYTKVIAKATNCSFTVTSNTESASHKGIVGNFDKPEITSRGWNVSVDSLDVLDVATLLSNVKSGTKFTLAFDEVSTADNQTPQSAAYQRVGDAYINDLRFQWDNRSLSTKSIQFTGTGPLTHATDYRGSTIVDETTPAYTKGQNVRLQLFSGPSFVGAARQLALHVSVSLEEVTTKDTSNSWQVQEPVGINYDITSNALVRSDETLSSAVTAVGFSDILDASDTEQPVAWKIVNASGNNNRTAGTTIVQGLAQITQMVANANNRQVADYTTTLNGYGPYEIPVVTPIVGD